MEGFQPHPPAASTAGERPGTRFTGGWVGPRAGLENSTFCPHYIYVFCIYLRTENDF